MKIDSQNETPYRGLVVNGFVMVTGLILLFIACVVAMILSTEQGGNTEAIFMPLSIVIICVEVFLLIGLFTQQPNQSRVMIFFGKYRGTFSKTGFYWCNPFCNRCKISLRIRNMDVEPIKVTDKIGNPELIGLVLVWRVNDTYKAVFDVNTDEPTAATAGILGSKREQALNSFVRIQSDAALREVTGQHAYDDSDSSVSDELTLRSGGEEINDRLERKLNERLAMAGIEVVEARINYLAYAPEIAAVMLRRQQASAVISAREKIVEGAVTMVKMALDRLSQEQVVELDEERKAAMVSNLLVVLCADEAAQPVVNTGSIYQ